MCIYALKGSFGYPVGLCLYIYGRPLYICKAMCIYALKVSFIHLVGLSLHIWGRWCISAVYMQSNVHICLNNVISASGLPLFAYMRPLVYICCIYAKQCANMPKRGHSYTWLASVCIYEAVLTIYAKQCANMPKRGHSYTWLASVCIYEAVLTIYAKQCAYMR